MKRHYLVVAEREDARESLAVLLRSEGLTVSVAASLADAVGVLRSAPVDTVLIASSGADAGAERLRARFLAERPDCRVITLSRVDSLRKGARRLRFGIGDYLLGERELIALLTARYGSADPGQEGPLSDQGVQALAEVVDVLVSLLELRDRHFAGSSHRAMELARTVALEMHLPADIVREVVLASLLRDIGKYGMDDTVFRTPGSLSDDQARRMREHVTGGIRLLEHIEFPWKIRAIIRHHHERYDGLGYPDGLRGPEIPLGARILAVVDAYVAMLSERPHRSALSTEEALTELERQAGVQFDPEVVEVFLRVVQDRRAPLSAEQKARIMIADRDPEFLNLMKMRLHNEGLEVQAETNMQDALLRMLESPPHLILAEVDDDESRSFEFLKLIREDDGLARVPFAFLVRQPDTSLAVRVLRQGVDDCLAKSDDLELLVARIRNILIRETRRHAKGDAPRRRGIAGQLENLSLPDIIQILNMGTKTACLSLSSENRAGKIWFDTGAAVHADTGPTTGELAVYEMLRWKTGEFTIEHGLQTEEKSIDSDTMLLVMDGLRLIDEGSAAPTAS